MDYEGASTNQLSVSVKDTGIGISSVDQASLFTRFGKMQRNSDLNNDGLGLGLLIVKELSERAGGKVEVFSEGKDKGSTFTFTMLLEAIPDEEE